MRSRRGGRLLIPHFNSGRGAGEVLRCVARRLGLEYLSTEAPLDEFIDTIRNATLVVSEAMHGAILADAMRTPWIPFAHLNHNEFKWRDWYQSIGLPYSSLRLRPKVWNHAPRAPRSLAKRPLRRIKLGLLMRSMQKVVSSQPLLSADDVHQEVLSKLREKVAYINRAYASRSARHDS